MSGIVGKGSKSGIIGEFSDNQIIQIQSRDYSTTNADSYSTETFGKLLDSSVAEYYCQIHNVRADSKILVNMQCQGVSQSQANEVGYGYGIIRGAAHSSSGDTTIYEPVKYATYDRQDNVSGYNESGTQVQIVYYDQSPLTGTNTYYLGARTNHANYSVTFVSQYHPFHCVLIELTG